MRSPTEPPRWSVAEYDPATYKAGTPSTYADRLSGFYHTRKEAENAKKAILAFRGSDL